MTALTERKREIVAAAERLGREGVLFGLSLTATRHNVDEILSDEVLDTFVDGLGARGRLATAPGVEVTTWAPASTPDSTATWSPRPPPSLTTCCRTPRYSFPSGVFMVSTMNTVSP